MAQEIPHPEDIGRVTSQENLTLRVELASAKEQLEKRPKLKPFGDVHYYVFDGEDIPYCPVCYGTKDNIIPLPAGEEWNGGFRRHCPACKNLFYEKPMAKERHQMSGRGGPNSWMR